MAMSRYWLLRLLSVFFGVALLLIAELLLRQVGWFEDSSAPELHWPEGMQPAYGLQQGQMLLEKDGQVNTHPSLVQGGFVQPRTFTEKHSSLRIFSFGGSATLGVPYEKYHHKTWSGKLEELFSIMKIPMEVINLGGASFGSAHVREFALQSLKYKPDALLIYAGNNEFFNYGLELLEKNKSFFPQYRYVQSLHLLRLLDKTLGLSKQQVLLPTAIKEEQDSTLSEIIAEILYREQYSINVEVPIRTDRIVREVQRRLVDNFMVIAEQASEEDIPVLIGLPPINWFTPPWMSLHHPLTSAKERASWKTAVAQARLLEQRNDFENAAIAWHRATTIDAWPAEAWYGLGMVNKQLGRPFQTELHRALVLDFHPGRPTPELLTSLEEQSWPDNVILVSFRENFMEKSEQFFHDSCHLTVDGNKAIAEGFMQRLVSDLGWGLSSLQRDN
jgi:hypothetical protein